MVSRNFPKTGAARVGQNFNDVLFQKGRLIQLPQTSITSNMTIHQNMTTISTKYIIYN